MSHGVFRGKASTRRGLPGILHGWCRAEGVAGSARRREGRFRPLRMLACACLGTGSWESCQMGQRIQLRNCACGGGAPAVAVHRQGLPAHWAGRHNSRMDSHIYNTASLQHASQQVASCCCATCAAAYTDRRPCWLPGECAAARRCRESAAWPSAAASGAAGSWSHLGLGRWVAHQRGPRSASCDVHPDQQRAADPGHYHWAGSNSPARRSRGCALGR